MFLKAKLGDVQRFVRVAEPAHLSEFLNAGMKLKNAPECQIKLILHSNLGYLRDNDGISSPRDMLRLSTRWSSKVNLLHCTW